MIRYKITKSCLTIADSYKVPTRRFDRELNSVEALHPESDIWKRSRKSLKREMAVHNFCYKVGYKRERTKDCDLNIPCDKPEWVYIVLGLLVWPFIE